MKRYLTPFFTAIALVTSAAVCAQGTGDSLADRVARFQALAAEGPAFKPAPQPADRSKQTPVRISIADYQALASDGPAFHHGVVGTGTMFADTNAPPPAARQAASPSRSGTAN